MPLEPLPVHEEGWCASDSGSPTSGDVREGALAKAVLLKRRLGLFLIQFEPPRGREQILS